MIVAPNQRMVICNTWKDGVIPENLQPYYINSKEVLSKAAHLLSPNAMLAYIYLSGNKDGYGIALSCVDICKWTGISESTYHRVVQELIKKHFIRLKEGSNNVYDFYLLPDFAPRDVVNLNTGCTQSDDICTQSDDRDVVKLNTGCSQVDDRGVFNLTTWCTQVDDRNNLNNLYNTLSDNPIHNLNDSLSDDLIGNTSSQENSINTSSQAKSISVAKKEEIDVGDCEYSFTDLVNAIRVIYRYDYDGAVERIKGTFEPEQRHEEKWRALGFTSPEGLQRAVERGRIKFTDEAEPP